MDIDFCKLEVVHGLYLNFNLFLKILFSCAYVSSKDSNFSRKFVDNMPFLMLGASNTSSELRHNQEQNILDQILINVFMLI